MGKRPILFAVVLLVLFVVSLLLVSIFVVFAKTGRNSGVFTQRDIHFVKTFDAKTKKTSKRLIHSGHELATLEYLFRQDGLKSEIISPFASQKFECFSECFCNDGSKRRNLISGSTGLMVAISAVSAAVAMKMSQEVFNAQCIAQFSNPYISRPEMDTVFDDSKVKPMYGEDVWEADNLDDFPEPIEGPDVDSSDRWKGHCDPADIEEAKVYCKEVEKEVLGKGVEFHCIGTCMPEKDVSDLAKKDAKCEEIELADVIDMPVYDTLVAKGVFAQEKLHPFCKSQSLKSGVNPDLSRYEFSVCSAFKFGEHENKVERFDNIECF